MIRVIMIRLIQCYELIRNKGWSSFIGELVYKDRKAVILEKNLLEVNKRPEILERSNVRFIELSPQTFAANDYRWPYRDRYLKALHYLKKGYCGYAIVRGNTIIGDTWYFASNKSDKCLLHPDIKWLGIKHWSTDYIYTFDIFVVPNERRNNLSAAFQNMAMYSVRRKGYLKAVAYYWADNIPSMWMTRVINKWKELKTIKLSRFFGLRKRPINP